MLIGARGLGPSFFASGILNPHAKAAEPATSRILIGKTIYCQWLIFAQVLDYGVRPIGLILLPAIIISPGFFYSEQDLLCARGQPAGLPDSSLPG